MLLVGVAVLFVLASPAGPPADATSRWFEVVNGTREQIRAIHVSLSRDSKWGPNRIDRPLNPGERASVVVTGLCALYDVRHVAEKGVEYVEDEAPGTVRSWFPSP